MLSQEDVQRAEESILRILRDSGVSFQPARLLKELEDGGISENSARVAIWYLIDLNLIELTMDRLLRAAHRDGELAEQQRSILSGG